MKNIVTNTIAILALLLMVNCSKDDYSFGDLTAPSNIQVAYEIIGASATAPDGDGTGMVKFTVKADDAISYKFNFNDGTIEKSKLVELLQVMDPSTWTAQRIELLWTP